MRVSPALPGERAKKEQQVFQQAETKPRLL